MNQEVSDALFEKYAVLLSVRVIRAVVTFLAAILLLSAQTYIATGHWLISFALAFLATLASMRIPVAGAFVALLALAVIPHGVGEFFMQMVR